MRLIPSAIASDISKSRQRERLLLLLLLLLLALRRGKEAGALKVSMAVEDGAVAALTMQLKQAYGVPIPFAADR